MRQTYVIVWHAPEGFRDVGGPQSLGSFTLDRTYGLLSDHPGELVGVPLGMRITDTWDGWKPTGGHQLPDWAKDIPSGEFKGIWVEPAPLKGDEDTEDLTTKK